MQSDLKSVMPEFENRQVTVWEDRKMNTQSHNAVQFMVREGAAQIFADRGTTDYLIGAGQMWPGMPIIFCDMDGIPFMAAEIDKLVPFPLNPKKKNVLIRSHAMLSGRSRTFPHQRTNFSYTTVAALRAMGIDVDTLTFLPLPGTLPQQTISGVLMDAAKRSAAAILERDVSQISLAVLPLGPPTLSRPTSMPSSL